MKQASTAFLQALIVLFGIAVLAFLLWEPQVEGVNAHATAMQKYVNVFVLFHYMASIPFFLALYQAFRVLSYVRRETTFSPRTVKALRMIKYCALALIGFAALSLLFMIGGDPEDRPAGLFLRILVTFPSIIVATSAAIVERILQNAVDLKSENDLTV